MHHKGNCLHHITIDKSEEEGGSARPAAAYNLLLSLIEVEVVLPAPTHQVLHLSPVRGLVFLGHELNHCCVICREFCCTGTEGEQRCESQLVAIAEDVMLILTGCSLRVRKFRMNKGVPGYLRPHFLWKDGVKLITEVQEQQPHIGEDQVDQSRLHQLRTSCILMTVPDPVHDLLQVSSSVSHFTMRGFIDH